MSIFRRNLISSLSNEGANNYMYIEALEDGLTVGFTRNALEYLIEGSSSWETLSVGATSPAINTGDRIYFRATGLTPVSNYGIGTFTISKYCNIGGNIMSLLFGDNAEDATNLTGYNYAFYKVFYNCKKIRSVSSGFLPATKLASTCYGNMFYGCTSLTIAPELPATTLVYDCYDSMFYGCTKLTTAPELPATALADYCYYCMFYSCSSLTTAPELPATTLAAECYSHMFTSCTSLTTTPELPATTLTERCYQYMFRGCTSLTTVPELPATTLADSCCYQMFFGCTSLITAPELPATTLAESCYREMFASCRGLTTAPELPATTLAESCYREMFASCRGLTTAPELPATTLANSCYSSMFKGCTSLNYIKALFTTSPSSSYTDNWVRDVASSGTFVKNLVATWDVAGVNGIPEGWSVEYNITLTECTSLSITANDVSGRATQTTIYYTATCNGIDDDGNELTGLNITGEALSEEFPQNTSTTDTVTRTISYTYMGITATTTIMQGVWINQGYILDLNNQWQVSSVTNPDSTLYDGVYESFSNKGVNNTAAIMYIDIVGYTDFSLYIRSYAESTYDYVMVSQLDQTITNSTSYSSTTLVKAHTRGSQTSGTAIGNYTLVEFTGIDEAEHRITVLYRKDSSGNRGDDKGYLLIPKNQ